MEEKPAPVFARLRMLADVLRLAAQTPLAVRPFAVELFRQQTAFNHLVVDLLEDAVWWGRLPDRAARIESRLGPWIDSDARVPRARSGPAGALVVGIKRLGVAGLEVALTDALRAMTRANRQLVDALKAGGGAAPTPVTAPLFEPWFAEQTEFHAAAAAFVPPEPTVPFVAPHPVAAADVPGVTIVVPEGETLTAGARAVFHAAFAADPELRLAYGDTYFTGPRTAALKPGWSPDYLQGVDYLGGCFAVRGPVPDSPRVLPADTRAIRIPEFLSQRAEPAPGPAGSRPTLSSTPRVSLVVPFRDKAPLLAGLLASLRRYDPGLPYDVILASNQSRERETFDLLEGLREPHVSWFAWDHPFNWSAINNAAARRATGDLLLFLNNDVEARHDGWLRSLAAYAVQPAIGAVGARLLYRDGSIQHAGVVLGLRGLAGHAFARWRPEYGPTAFGDPTATRNWSAVTGACLMVRRALFEEVRGFDERFVVTGSDVAFCLRLRARGLRTVNVGHVALTHFESVSRRPLGVLAEDLRLEAEAYGGVTEPYWHPRLSREVGHGYP